MMALIPASGFASRRTAMGFSESISSGFRKYADFGGRSSRSELWFWLLFTLLAGVGLIIVDVILGTSGGLTAVFALVVLVPTMAVEIRRLHDIDRSGSWWLIGFVPLIGAIFLIVWWTKVGHEGLNKYGRNPLTA
jgi:uncharacterized membrane protein YhaH (DUF805 family)